MRGEQRGGTWVRCALCLCSSHVTRHLLDPLDLLALLRFARLLLRRALRRRLGNSLGANLRQPPAVLLPHRRAARHALQQEGGPFHLMEPVGADEGARVALQLGGGVPPADLARALEREHRAVRHEHHERRRAVQLADEAEVGQGSLEAEEGDDGDRVAAPPLLDQPDPHLCTARVVGGGERWGAAS